MGTKTNFGQLEIGQIFTDALGFNYTKISETEARINSEKPSVEPKGAMQYEFDTDDRVGVQNRVVAATKEVRDDSPSLGF